MSDYWLEYAGRIATQRLACIILLAEKLGVRLWASRWREQDG